MAYGGTNVGTSGKYSQATVQGSGNVRKFYGNRGIFGGGYTGSRVNTMDYVTIASTGNATDFGDFTEARDGAAGISNVNGGLQ